MNTKAALCSKRKKKVLMAVQNDYTAAVTERGETRYSNKNIEITVNSFSVFPP